MNEFLDVMLGMITPEVVGGLIVVLGTILNFVVTKKEQELREYGNSIIVKLERELPKTEGAKKFQALCQEIYGRLPKIVQILLPYKFIELYAQYLFDTIKEALDFRNEKLELDEGVEEVG